MKIEIKHEGDHYVAYVNGKFFGSYDTPAEAAQGVEEVYGEEN